MRNRPGIGPAGSRRESAMQNHRRLLELLLEILRLVVKILDSLL